MSEPPKNDDAILSAINSFYEQNPDLLKRQQEAAEWFNREYPLHPWGLDDLIRYGVKKLLNELFDRIARLEQELKDWDSNIDLDGFSRNDACYTLHLEQVACRQAMMGLLAPLAETLLHESAKSLEHKFSAMIAVGTSKNDRTALKDKDFWDPEVVFRGLETDQNGNSIATKGGGICEGYFQLIKAIGLGSDVPGSCEVALTALFAFRNKSLHRIVWSKTKDDKGKDAAQRFDETIKANGWDKWFSVTRVFVRSKQGEWVEAEIQDITIERQFAEDVLAEIEALGANLAKRI